MSNTFIQEAFKQFYLTEDAEEFSLNVSGPDDVESFLDVVAPEEDEEVISDVYDLEAEAKEDLKQSYIGKVILDCNVCHSNVFFNKDEITENEDGLCCVEIECPYCMSNEGYTIIGEVKPYQEEGDVDIEDIETEEVPEEPVDDVEIDVEETEEEPEVEEEIEESVKEEKEEEPEEDLKESLEEGYNLKRIREVEKELNADFSGLTLDEYDEDNRNIYLVVGDAQGNSEKITIPKWELDEVDLSYAVYTYVEDAVDEGNLLAEGLKADEVKELRGNEEINGADGPIAAVDELEGNDEIRGPKYKELNEEVEEEKEELEESLKVVPIFTFEFDDEDEALAFSDAFMESEFSDAYTPELAGDNTVQLFGDGSFDGNAAVAELEDIVNAFSNFKFESVNNLKECGDPEKLDECGGGDAELVEGIEDVSINTEDENITMTTKEDGGVVVETSPKEDAVVEDEVIDDTEMIAPVEPETEADIEDAVEMNGEEEAPMDDFDLEDVDLEGGEEELGDDFEEFDEESFDNLGESYLKRCYENVTSFKTSNITLNENKEFIIEGKIGFDSGNEKDTQFIFAKKSSEDGKLKLEGYNKQISNGKKTFKLNCSINDKSLVCESLNYNYKGKNDLNESVRVYGTVKRK